MKIRKDVDGDDDGCKHPSEMLWPVAKDVLLMKEKSRGGMEALSLVGPCANDQDEGEGGKNRCPSAPAPQPLSISEGGTTD
jgi:hypothetical protein